MPKRSLAALAILLAVSIAAAQPPSPRGDVVLITIDTLRADALGFAGNAKVQTPVLDRLASQGRVFPNAHAHNVVTLPSHTNILSGLYPYQHGVRDNSGFTVPAGIPTLATVLKAAGYSTGAFVGSFPLDSQFGLDRGFQVYDDRYPKGSHPEAFGFAERRGSEVISRAVAWWNGQKGKPRFLWVHLYDPHAPYAPPEPFASRFASNPYLGEVAAVDSFLAPLLGPFLDGKEKPALVVVTSDHGEALGEHGELTHGLFAYEATLKVPLVLWGKGIAPGKDGRAARHVDVFPTVMQAAGVSPPAPPGGMTRPGRSLLAPAPKEPQDTYFEALSATLNRGWAPLRGLLRQNRKFIALPLPEVYDLPRDPREEKNLFDTERAAARTAFSGLPKESAWPPRREDLTPEQEAHLRSLGYLSSSVPVRESYGPEDDPKRLIPLDTKIQRITELYALGKIDEAIRVGREVVQARPSMALGYSLLSQSLLEADRTEEALTVMRDARAKGAASDSLLRQLGLTLAETGKAAEAIEVLRPLTKKGSPESANALALALSEAGKQKEAFDTLEQVLKTDPDNPKAYEQLGLVALRVGDWQQARAWSQKALEQNPELPLAWNNLGVALFQLRQPDPALDAWQKAVDLDPRLWDALWNLGVQAAGRGRKDQAKRALERFVAGAPSRYAEDVKKARDLLARMAS